MAERAGAEPDRVWIFDTTLRDGEQAPGASLRPKEKLEIAKALESLGADVIEAGFPITSDEDFEAVSLVASEIKRATVAGLARCVEKDIVRAAEAVKTARHPRIHVFLATSGIHRKYKLKKAKGEILRLAVEGVKTALKLCNEVEFSPEDASRTEPEFLAEVVEAVIEAGAAVVNIPDTVGYAVPGQFGGLISYLYEHVRNIDQAVISVHCHNDLGLAVANSLSAVEAGARQVECTVNGLGERAGNAALEEIVMGMRTRRDFFKLTTGINTRKLYPTSRLVSSLTGMTVQRNKAVVGENAFAHEAGIHVHGVLSHRSTYEIMRPEDVGYGRTRIVLGKHTGRHAVEARIKEMGFLLSRQEIERVKSEIKTIADKKKTVFDADLEAVVMNIVGKPEKEKFEFISFQVMTGKNMVPVATVTLKVGGEERTDASAGDGPVAAIFTAIDRITGMKGRLLEYRIDAVTGGREALGEVRVVVAFGKTESSGRGASPDILEASATAYLQALNRVASLRRGRK